MEVAAQSPPMNLAAVAPPSTTARLPGLDLLRALAIAWVMLFHSVWVGGVGPDWEGLARFGWVGVDVFFVLSGFLIGAPLLRQLQEAPARFSLAGFYVRRAWRILPAYLTVLAVYLAFPVLREDPNLESAWKFLSFSFNLLVDYARNPAFSHAWSLCVEEHFYLLFPLLALGLSGRVKSWQLLALFAALVLGGVVLRGAIWQHYTALQPDRAWFIEALYYPTWSRLDALLVGVLLAVAQVHRPRWWAWAQRHANAVLALGLLVLGLAWWLFRARTGLLANTLGWPVLAAAAGLLVLAGASPHSLIGRWRLPGVAWIAAISYSLYLSHKLALHAVQTWLLPWLPELAALQFAAYVAVILLFGAVLHYGIERPGLRWRERGRAQAPPRSEPSPA